MRGISWLAENRLASQGQCCKEWVSKTFRVMPLVLVNYTIQAVWSFCNNQLTVIIERTTRTASGAEEMLLHVAIRSADLLFIFICVSVLLTRALHRLECWKWLPGVLNYYLQITVYILWFKLCQFWLLDLLLFTNFVLTTRHSLPFLGKIFIISVSSNNRTFDVLTFRH